LNKSAKQNQDVINDIQEFGDRLDVLVSEVESGKAAVLKSAAENNIEPPQIVVSNPIWKCFRQQAQRTASEKGGEKQFHFQKHDQKPGAIAIGADQIAIHFGDFQRSNQSVSKSNTAKFMVC